MIKIKLVTSNDGLAAEVEIPPFSTWPDVLVWGGEIPPFSTWPDVLVWGERIFLKTADEGVYREGFAYYVPAIEGERQ